MAAGSSRYQRVYRIGGDPEAFLGDDPVLLRPYDQHWYARAPDRDDRIVHVFCIERDIDGYTQELEGLADGSANLWRVFADPGRVQEAGR